MKNIFTRFLFLALLLFVAVVSNAQLASLEQGHVYFFRNVGETTKAMAAVSLNDVNPVNANENSKAQLWYVESATNATYVLRNLATGRYLSNSARSNWGLTEQNDADHNKFKLFTFGGNNTIRSVSQSSDGYGYMHRDNNGNIVGWEPENQNTQWTIVDKNFTAEEVQTALNEIHLLAPSQQAIEGYQQNLNTLFTSLSCTTLKNEYLAKSLDEVKADANYTNLPSALQAMVVKVYNEQKSGISAWDEANGDNNKPSWGGEYSKKFRVQMYEPYSIAGEITEFLGINAHINMDNPTGVYINDGEVAYIMVEGSIKEGSELWVNYQVGHNVLRGYNDKLYIQLHEGLNVVPYFEDKSELWINYVVHTYDKTKEEEARFPHKISEFEPLKIHVEGGYIGGFYNAVGDYRAKNESENLWGEVDNDADWVYMEERTPLTDLVLVAHRQVLKFNLNTTHEGDNGMAHYLPDNLNIPAKPYNNSGSYDSYEGMGLNASTGKINIMLEAWDRVMYSELVTMGVVSTGDLKIMNEMYPRWTAEGEKAEIYNYGSVTVADQTATYKEFCEGRDYSELFNHHGLAWGEYGTTYMYGGGSYCGYHHNTLGSIVGEIANNSGSTWGPAHEIGHQHQGTYLLNGQTEVTNNLFSNVALWYKGMTTSRYNGSQGSLENMLAIFNTEKNTYTQLSEQGNGGIWALTHMYYKLWLYYHLAGNNTQFWPRFYELCRRERPVNGGEISGPEGLLRIYRHACDAAGEDLTEFFRAYGHLDVMDRVFVGDYSNAYYTQTQEQVDEAIKSVKDKNYPENVAILFIGDDEKDATGYVQHDGVTKRPIYGETTPNSDFGSVADFIKGNTGITANYTATVSADGKVTMSGGAGGVGFLVFNEKGELVSFSNKSEFSPSSEALYMLATGAATIKAIDADSNEYDVETDMSALQGTLLEALIEEVVAMGIENDEKIDDILQKVGYWRSAPIATLKSYLAQAREVLASGVGYSAAYENLYSEYNKVRKLPEAKVTIAPGAKYAIKNVAGNDYMTINANGAVVTTGSSTQPTQDTALWVFEKSGDNYYIKNAGKNKYLQKVSNSNSVNFTIGNDAVDYIVTEHPTDFAVYAFSTQEFPGRYMDRHSQTQVATWNAISNNAKWTITLAESADVQQNLQDKSTLQMWLSATEKLMSEVAPITSMNNLQLQAADETGDYYISSNATEAGHEPQYLIDGNNSTFFHTLWKDDAPDADHYIQIDCGETHSLEQFRINYKTRDGGNVDAPKTIVVGGSNNPDNGFTTIATLTHEDATNPLPITIGQNYVSPILGSSATSYRYIRLTVTNATGNKHKNHYYFGLAELSVEGIGYETGEIYDDYKVGVTEEVFSSAVNASVAGKISLMTLTDVQTATTNLQTAYDNLYDQYQTVVTAKKQELKTLIADTQALITDAGGVYLLDGELALQAGDSNVNFYISSNAEHNAGNSNINDHDGGGVLALIDNNENTYFHTRWKGTMVNEPHYIQVDLGEGKSVNKFTFSYKPRNLSPAPTAMTVSGSNDGTSFTDVLATITEGLPAHDSGKSYESQEIDSETAYRYLRFTVTGSHGPGTVQYGGYYFFAMLEFDLTAISNITIKDEYPFVTEEQMLATALVKESASTMAAEDFATTIPAIASMINNLQAAKEKLEALMVTVDKSDLEAYLVTAGILYNEFASGDTIATYYQTSPVTIGQISDLKEAIEAANSVVANKKATQEIVDASLATLSEKAEVLQGIKNLDYKAERTINDEITEAQNLFANIVTATEAGGHLALQASDKNALYYIWSNAPADDSHGIPGGLIDKNSDGTANTSTFFGTDWQNGNVASYSHYLEIDLGSVKSLNNLTFDYTTRKSDYANQRPDGIKIFASNDKQNYTEVFAVTSGLVTEANEKWSLETPVKFVGRYMRFAVTTDVGFFNMSDFNVYTDGIYSLTDFYTTSGIDATLLQALNEAVQRALPAVNSFITEDDYNTALEGLSGALGDLNDFKNARVTDRSELNTLKETVKNVVDETAKVTEGETVLALQCSDENAPYYIYCNADGSTNSGNDALGVSALFDDDTTNHLHTTYTGNAYDDNLDHYLRLDMGENKAMVSFKFSYTGRVDNVNNAPTKMLIEGSNDLEKFEEIAKLEIDVPTSGTATYTTPDVLSNGRAYRYIRFMVTETKNKAKYKNHQYFVLSQFSVTACKTIEVADDFVSPNLPLATLVEANNEVVDAGDVINFTTYLTQTMYDGTKNELQAAYDALLAARLLKSIPVKLTTDINNPVLYKIMINRGNGKLLQFDSSDKKVAVSNHTYGVEYQAWFFMKGTVADRNDDVLIYPYWNDGAQNSTLRLGAESTGNNPGTVVAVEAGNTTYTKQNWYITNTNSKAGWWNIRPETEDNYFSNFGGDTKKMGFWNQDSSTDGGSNFQFVLDETNYSLSDAYFALYNRYAECGGAKVGGTAIGMYSEESVSAFNTSATATKQLLDEASSTDDVYTTALTTFNEAYVAIERNMPVQGKFYKIRSAFKTADGSEGYSYGGLVYANDNNYMQWAKDYDENSSRAIWYFEPVNGGNGGYNIRSLHTSAYAPSLGQGSQGILAETASVYTIEVLDDATGILKVKSTGSPMHAQADGNALVGWQGNLNSASAWVIEELIEEEMENVGLSLSLNTATGESKCYSTLNSAYPVKLPESVDAFIITAKADNGLLTMVPVTDENNRVVPAFTPVILSTDKDDSSSSASVLSAVTFSNEEPAVTVAEGDNMLFGTLTVEYIQCNGNPAYKVYSLGRKNNKVAMYWAYANYRRNDDGTFTKVASDTNEGGYVKLGANKAYLKLGGGDNASQATVFSFFFGGSTTGIGGVEAGDNPFEGTIYDLQGRKVVEIKTPGFYIVNGEKVYVSEVE